MIPYARQWIDDDDIQAVTEILRSDFLTQGPAIPRFEAAVAAYTGAKFAIAMSNATSSLHVGIKALAVGAGDVVWTSPNSFVASANCARYAGAEVDFVDIDPKTYNISIEALERKLESADRAGRLPKVVVAVDFAGQPCDYNALSALRSRYGFRLISDASHAIGAQYSGRRIGSGGLADITIFSFHPVKIITTAEGGMLVTDDAEIATRAELLRSHGITRNSALMRNRSAEPWEYEMLTLGFNYRLTDIQAALGSAQIGRIDRMLGRRREIAARYDRELADLPLVLPFQDASCLSALHLYPVQVRDDAPLSRRELYDALRERKIVCNVHYMPIYLQPYYAERGFSRGYCPNAEAYYERALSLPMYANLTESDQERVLEALRELLDR